MKLIPRQNTFHFKGEFKLIIQMLFSKDWRNGNTLLELEQRFAKYIGCKYAILVPSLAFGMTQTIKALADKGSEIICPAFSHYSLPLAVLLAETKPIFVDVNYETLNIDAKEAENKLTSKSKGIIVSHFGGRTADLSSMLEIAKQHNLFVISDCAHSCGAECGERKLGAIEDAAYFSFGTGKNLDGFGGGILTTNNEMVAQKIRESLELYCRWPNKLELISKIVRGYIQWLLMKPPFFHLFTYPLIWISCLMNKEIDLLYKLANIGENRISRDLSIKDKTRFSNLQAKIVLKQLDFLDIRNEKARNNAHFLSEQLSDFSDIGLPKELPKTKSVPLLYPIKVKNRLDLPFKLLNQGIDVRKKYFAIPYINLKIFAEFKTYCPTAEKLVQELLYLPVYAELEKDDILKIINGIKRAESDKKKNG